MSDRAYRLLRVAVALLVVLAMLYAIDLKEPTIGMWGCSGSMR